MDLPVLHENLLAVQSEQVPWVKRNFPDRLDGHPLHGVVEELGELMDARTLPLTADALADALIYMCDYASACSLTLASCYANALGITMPLTTTPGDLLRCVGKLSHAHLKMAQKIRGSQDEHQAAKILQLGRLTRMLENYATQRGLNLANDLLDTWKEVRKRNWRDWPTGGGEDGAS